MIKSLKNDKHRDNYVTRNCDSVSVSCSFKLAISSNYPQLMCPRSIDDSELNNVLSTTFRKSSELLKK